MIHSTRACLADGLAVLDAGGSGGQGVLGVGGAGLGGWEGGERS